MPVVASSRVIRVQAEIPFDSGQATDVAVNSWWFHQDPITGFPDDVDNVFDMVSNFYTVQAPDAIAPLAQQYSSVCGNELILTAYNMEDSTPRVPILTRTVVFQAGAQGLPNEVALCMSFQGDPVSGERQAQRRGRVFLGPLDNKAATVTDAGLPGSILMDIILRAGKQLILESNASGNWSWGVDSPTRRGNPALPESFTAIESGWVDNAFDTQRSRGPAPTVRSPFDSATPA